MKKLTKPASKTSPPPADDPGSKRMPRTLGKVDGFPVMLLFRKSDGCPFYKLTGAMPEEWTGSVTDPANPSFADALASLLSAMKRGSRKGITQSADLRPTVAQVVAEAERYRAERASAAAAEDRRATANVAFAEAAADDQDEADHEPAERDCHAPVTPVTRDTVTVTFLSRSESVTCPPNSSDDKDFGSVTCHDSVTLAAPSSSSVVFSGSSPDEVLNTTPTTRAVTPAERDAEDDILGRLLEQADPLAGERQRAGQDYRPADTSRAREWIERVALALNTTADAVAYQRRNDPSFLLTRMKAAGIDPKTGHPVDAEGSSKPVEARADIGMTTDTTGGDNPSEGVLEARGLGDADHEHDDTLTTSAA